MVVRSKVMVGVVEVMVVVLPSVAVMLDPEVSSSASSRLSAAFMCEVGVVVVMVVFMVGLVLLCML